MVPNHVHHKIQRNNARWLTLLDIRFDLLRPIEDVSNDLGRDDPSCDCAPKTSSVGTAVEVSHLFRNCRKYKLYLDGCRELTDKERKGHLMSPSGRL